jgi:hypothetical protein
MHENAGPSTHLLGTENCQKLNTVLINGENMIIFLSYMNLYKYCNFKKLTQRRLSTILHDQQCHAT